MNFLSFLKNTFELIKKFARNWRIKFIFKYKINEEINIYHLKHHVCECKLYYLIKKK